MPERVLITGATGFIGRRLATTLVAGGQHVVRGTTRTRDARLPAGVEAVRGFDLSSLSGIHDAVAGADRIVHLAGRVHVTTRIDQEEMDRYDSINVDGTVALARSAAAAGVRRFVFISTIAVNGTVTPPGHAFTEADAPRPQTSYAHSKREAEDELVAIARKSGMEVVRIRPPLVYGPGVKANFRAMMNWIGKGVPLPFGAVTENRRTLVSVDNLNSLIVTCLSHPAAANELFLAGDGEDLSTADLLRRLADAMGRRARLLPVSPRLLQAALESVGLGRSARRLLQSLQVDHSKAHRILDWQPPVSVDEGLARAAGKPARTI